jgi:hypothetical protein
MTAKGQHQYHGARALANARRLSAEATQPRISDAIRQVLGIDKRDRAAVPPKKISLARVHFLERDYPSWWNEPQPPRPRRKGR